MLVRLLYASRAVSAVDQEELHSILKQSKADNARNGITGALCLCTQERIFVQVLEGSRSVVNDVYRRILADTRHVDVVLLQYEEIEARRFRVFDGRITVPTARKVVIALRCWAAARFGPASRRARAA